MICVLVVRGFQWADWTVWFAVSVDVGGVSVLMDLFIWFCQWTGCVWAFRWIVWLGEKV